MTAFYSRVFITYQCLPKVFTMSTKHTKGFTHEYLPLVGYYSRVKNYMTGDTRKYFQLTHEQCIPRVTRAQQESYLQNFSRHDASHVFVCKLGRERYHSKFMDINITSCCYILAWHCEKFLYEKEVRCKIW